MNTIKKFLYIAVTTFAFTLVVAQIVITNELAGVRNDIHSLDSQIAVLTDEHDILSHQVASASALATISQKASEAGFVSPSKNSVVSLGETLSVAVNLQMPSSDKNTVQ